MNRIWNPHQSFLSSSLSETRAIAQRWSENLAGGCWVFIDGPLGVGKTLFVKSVIEKLGFSVSHEGSPTFSIAHENEHDHLRYAHLDLYRIESVEELEARGIFEYFQDPEKLIFVEWMSKFPGLMEKLVSRCQQPWMIRMDYQDREQRSIRIFKRPTS